MNDKIDFVITWVDGDDTEWLKSKKNYLGKDDKPTANLYRSWDNLQYWFRGVEKFTPWVNKIHFVTCGHLPKWLNIHYEKLNIVKHSDYMPKEYLPTFSSHAIELNLHRIEGLAEQFVYFNDDSFILDSMRPTDFFKTNLPCDCAVLSSLVPWIPDPCFHYLLNSISIINREFSKNEVIKSNLSKWFNVKYGRLLLKNIYYSPVRGFSGFFNFHLPSSFLKTTFTEVWEKAPDVLDSTSQNKFRTIHDVNQYVFSYWQFASGHFAPTNKNNGRFFIVGENDSEIIEAMSLRKYKMICINDSILVTNFNEIKEELKKQFQRLLPDKSAFEL